MARYYNKDELKEKLEIGQIYDLVEAWGGEPEYTDKGLVCQTICHNLPGEGSRKLQYYSNTQLFVCYTSCGTFDIFDLCIKVMRKQYDLSWELYDAMDYIASYFGFEGQDVEKEKDQKLEDWDVFKRHKIQYKTIQPSELKEYDSTILSRFAYPRILDWEREGIKPEISKLNRIGYYPGGEQITIPHFDINNRLIGIRGRSLAEMDAERYGKYRPLKVGNTTYNHPLSMNLYNLNNSKNGIKRNKVAIIFESEKACLMYQSYYGRESDVSVACCGQNISSYQIEALRRLGVREVIVAFDRDFKAIGDETFYRLKNKLIHLYKRYSKVVNVTAIFDKKMVLPQKASPIDAGKETFEQLLNERIIPR